MKQRFLMLALVLSCLSAQAFVSDIVTIDVFGNGSWYNSDLDQTTYFTGSIAPDPTGGSLTGLALVYRLPDGLTFNVDGDYALSSRPGDAPSHIVRLTGDNQLIFYSITGISLASQNGLPVSQPADTPTIPRLIDGYGWQQQSTVTSLTPFMPGYTGSQIEYIFEIPEPTTVSLLLAGAGVLALRRRFFPKKAS